MNKKRLLALAAALALTSAGFYAAPAEAQVVVSIFPPPAFVASATPAYFEGHPTYWWGGHWYWRDPYGWHMYQAEPPFLFEWRGHHPFHPRYFEPRGRWHR